MPTSRHRSQKSRHSRNRRKAGPRRPLYTVKDTHRIKPHVLEKLREDIDFRSMIRVCRVFNVLTDTGVGMLTLGTPETPRKERAWYRHLFNAAGYAYEALQVVESLRLRYVAEPTFDKFLAILEAPDYSRRKKVVKLMRDSAAFHLDQDDKSTRECLKSLRLEYYDFLASDSPNLDGTYYRFVDTVDINYVIDRLKTPEHIDETAIVAEVVESSQQLANDLMVAANEFIGGMMLRLGFALPPETPLTVGISN